MEVSGQLHAPVNKPLSCSILTRIDEGS